MSAPATIYNGIVLAQRSRAAIALNMLAFTLLSITPYPACTLPPSPVGLTATHYLKRPVHEFDLRDSVPDDATTIPISVMVKPRCGSIAVRRSLNDDCPLVMSSGARTTIGVPEGRVLYISASPLTEEFKVFVAGWYRK